MIQSGSCGISPWSSLRAPRSSRLLDLTMDWLIEAASTHSHGGGKGYGDERHLTDG